MTDAIRESTNTMGQIFTIPILTISWPVTRGAIAKPDWVIKNATALNLARWVIGELFAINTLVFTVRSISPTVRINVEITKR